MSGKKRFQKPGSLQPNIDDILEWSKLPEDAFDPASSQEKADFTKIAKVFPTGQMHGAVFAETKLQWLLWVLSLPWLFSDLWDRAWFLILISSRYVVLRRYIHGIILWKIRRKQCLYGRT